MSSLTWSDKIVKVCNQGRLGHQRDGIRRVFAGISIGHWLLRCIYSAENGSRNDESTLQLHIRVFGHKLAKFVPLVDWCWLLISRVACIGFQMPFEYDSRHGEEPQL